MIHAEGWAKASTYFGGGHHGDGDKGAKDARASRIKLLMHDGLGVWCAARRLNEGRFVWRRGLPEGSAPMTPTEPQFDALVLGLPWQWLAQMRDITRM